MAMVSEYDIERAAWNNSESGGTIARNSGAKSLQHASSTVRPIHINIGAGKVG